MKIIYKYGKMRKEQYVIYIYKIQLLIEQYSKDYCEMPMSLSGMCRGTTGNNQTKS